jgi:hypothetical protein
MRRRSVILLCGILLAAAAAVPARADFGPPSLLTVSPLEQADGVSASALSADGRYLVFAGSLGGIKGVLRRDLRTGLTEPVAAGDAYGTAAVLDADRPSVSAGGRYVSFTTTAALDPADDVNTAPDVYVRDMEASIPAGGAACPAGGPCAYTLASARDGAAAGLSYTGAKGSAAAPRSALSADGRRVAFVVQADSDLAGPGTPAGQVAARDLDTLRTTLVSSERDPATGAMTGAPVQGGAVAASYAALSADGTTVAWSGAHIDRQAATIDGDPARAADAYDEPLWRRIAGGPGAPTRRVAGAADPDAPGCPPGGTIAIAACQGPYPNLGANSNPSQGTQGGWLARPGDTDALPALSADGRTVAFVGGPPLPPKNQYMVVTDLFVADMRDGLPRRDGVTRLTQELDTADTTKSVGDLAIAPDGRRIAFSTARIEFSLAPPFLVGRPPAQPGVAELWLVDLDGQTLQRLSTPVDGGPSTLSPNTAVAGPSGPASPTFDATGTLVAFDSPASNLVAVDANNANDAFLVRDTAPPAGVPGRVDLGAPPPAPVIPRAWRMAVRAVAQRDGTVRLDADVPGAGVARATVRATVPVWKTTKVKQRGGGHRTVRRRVLASRQVAVVSQVTRAGGLSRLTARATKAYRSLVTAKAGLDATATVTFAAPARATLRDTLAVRFRVVPAKTAKPTRAKTKTKAKTKR